MTSTRLPKTITAGALLATPIPPVKWIIPGLLPAGLAIFAGSSDLFYSQQGGQKLADTVALLTDFARKICVGA